MRKHARVVLGGWRWSPSVALLVLIHLTATAADAQLIVAHRGASFEAPENTLAAFELAWKKQADAIEGDFYLTKDKQIVCIHDKTTERVAPQQPERSVAKSTLAELRQLDVGSWKNSRYADEKIPTLPEVIATVPKGKKIFVEVKCGVEILPLLKVQLEESPLQPEQIVIICFDQEVVRQSRKMMPKFKSNWLTSYKQNALTRRWKPARGEVLNTLRQTGATGLGTKGDLNVINPSFAAAIHQAGFELHIWTVNDPEPARVFKTLGALSITTDRPAFIRAALASSP